MESPSPAQWAAWMRHVATVAVDLTPAEKRAVRDIAHLVEDPDTAARIMRGESS